MNYRKYYEKELKCKIPKGWHIHHIDLDRNNNEINNLVAIPKKLHEEFHRVHYEFTHFSEYKIEEIVCSYPSFYGYRDVLSQFTECINRYYNIKKQIDCFITHRMSKQFGCFYKFNLGCY